MARGEVGAFGSEKGSLIILNGLLPHRSLEDKVSRSHDTLTPFTSSVGTQISSGQLATTSQFDANAGVLMSDMFQLVGSDLRPVLDKQTRGDKLKHIGHSSCWVSIIRGRCPGRAPYWLERLMAGVES